MKEIEVILNQKLILKTSYDLQEHQSLWTAQIVQRGFGILGEVDTLTFNTFNSV